MCFLRLVNCVLSCVLWCRLPHLLIAGKEGIVDHLQDLTWIFTNIKFRLEMREVDDMNGP